MSNGETGGANQEVAGVQPEELRVDESKLVEVSRSENKRRQLIDRWDRSLERSKDIFKEKLVGGKTKHKKKLDRIIGDSKDKLREIERMNPNDQAKEFKKLESESERKIERLIKEVGDEAKDMGDIQVGWVANKDSQTRLVWQKWQEIEVAKKKFEKIITSGRGNERDLGDVQAALVNKQVELNSLVTEMGDDFKTGDEIRELFKLEVGDEIKLRVSDNGEGAREADKIKKRVEEMVARVVEGREEQISAHELGETIKEVSELITNGQLNEERKSELRGQVVLLGGKLEEIRLAERLSAQQVIGDRKKEREADLAGADKARLKGKLSDEQYESIKKDLEKRTEAEENLLKAIRDKDDEAASRLVRGLESGAELTESIDDFVNTYGNMDRATTSSRERWDGIKKAASEWASHEEGSRSIMNPEVAKEEAMREVITYAMERLSKRGGEEAVTEEDIKEWAFSKIELMIKSGDEATGYSARQHISQVSQIFAAEKLDFAKEIRKRTDYRGQPVKHMAESVLTGEHCRVITNESRDMIESMMAVAQFSNVYNHSQGPEDVLRASAALEMWHIGDMLKARGTERGIKGKVGFYAVEVNDNHKVSMAETAKVGEIEYRKAVGTKFTNIYEKVVNGNGGEVKMYVEGKEYSLEKLSEMMEVNGDVNIRPAELMNLMHQERFANQLLSTDGGIKERAREELVREAIKIELGLVDIDGNLNIAKLEDIAGGTVSFKIGEREIDPTKMRLRAHLAVTEFDGQAVDWDQGIKEKNFTEVEQHFRWAQKLAEGAWRFSGTGIGGWDKHHHGNSEDWNRKILHLVPYLSKFGVGTAYLRETCSTDFKDIFSQRGGELILNKMGEMVEFYDRKGRVKEKPSDDEAEASSLLNLLLTDKDGFLMARSRMVDMLHHYNSLKDGNKTQRVEADTFMRERLERLATNKYGEREGKIKFNRAWKVLKNGKFGFDEKENGFVGYLDKVKETYRFENFDWGTTWNERIVKEYQYQVAADKFRGAMIGWLMKPNNTEAMITAIQTPAYYGETASTRKFKMMFEKHKEYFTRAGAGGLMYPVLDEAYNNTDYDGYPDAWDGVLDYKKEWKAPGFFAAREMGAKPFLLSHFENLVTQAQRGRVLSNVEDAHELKNEVVTGKWMRNVDVAIEKSPPVLKQMLQVTRFSLLGGDVPVALGGGIIKRLWGSAYFEGIIGWILKKIKELVADVWRHKGDIVSGTLSEAGQQVGDSLKN